VKFDIGDFLRKSVETLPTLLKSDKISHNLCDDLGSFILLKAARNILQLDNSAHRTQSCLTITTPNGFRLLTVTFRSIATQKNTLLRLHSNNGYANASQYYVIRAWRILLIYSIKLDRNMKGVRSDLGRYGPNKDSLNSIEFINCTLNFTEICYIVRKMKHARSEWHGLAIYIQYSKVINNNLPGLWCVSEFAQWVQWFYTSLTWLRDSTNTLQQSDRWN
jgi:hypothetical protein